MIYKTRLRPKPAFQNGTITGNHLSGQRNARKGLIFAQSSQISPSDRPSGAPVAAAVAARGAKRGGGPRPRGEEVARWGGERVASDGRAGEQAESAARCCRSFSLRAEESSAFVFWVWNQGYVKGPLRD